MIFNPPLIVVSALFFLALASVLYVGAWLMAAALMQLGQGRLSHAANKRALLTALLLPPALAAIPTFGGATLEHSHATPALEHHSMACREMFASFSAATHHGLPGSAGDVLGTLVNGAAWLLLGMGIFLLLRLARATRHLEDGLAPYLAPPSPRLAASLARVSRCLPGLPTHRFYECAIPAAYSSALGLRRIRCVLSRAFVAEAADEELDALVAHEAGHLRAGDVPATLLVGALGCLFFPLRPVRLLARRWREEAELACDDAAVAATRRPLALAAAILRVGGAPVSPTGQALPAIAMPFADDAACPPGKRVERLIAQAQRTTLPKREPAAQVWGGWLATLALALLGIAVLHSAAVVCYAHCSLEAVSQVLP